MTTARHPQPRVSRLYRNGTLVFIGLAIVVAGVIAFIAFSATTVTVMLTSHDVTATTTVNVAATADADTGTLAGTILTITKEGSAEHDVPATGATINDYARGTVTITNNWTTAQPLAATTRLKASSNGLIYRTTKRVDVPAGGTVSVEVVCDTAGAAGDIGPDHFEIVALWSGLKDKIYGDSVQAMTGGTKPSTSLAQATIDEATAALEQQLLSEAAASIPSAPDGMTVIETPLAQESTITSSAEAGDAVDSFTVRGSTAVTFVALDTDALQLAIASAFAAVLSADEELTGNTPTESWDLIELNERQATASLSVTLTAQATLSADSQPLDPASFTDRTAEDIRSQLLGIADVSDIRVSIAPFWATRTPSREDRITVTVTR